MSPQFWWYVSRASGMVAAVLIALTMIWGLLITTKLIEHRGLPAWLTDLHRHLGTLSVAFTLVHLVALIADSYLTFSVVDVLVPFASAWKAGAAAWGVGAFWGLAIVQGTSLAKRRLPRRWWWIAHLLAYPVALATTLHAAQAGTDASNPVFRAVSLTLIVALTALTLFRVLYRPRRRSVRPTGARSTGPNGAR